jgi:hypothetical protein
MHVQADEQDSRAMGKVRGCPRISELWVGATACASTAEEGRSM